MITGLQIKAALTFLRWSRRRLHEETGIPERTIQRIAEVDGVPNANAKTVAKIQSTLEAAGIVLIPENGGGPGVRLRDRPDTAE